MKRDQILIQRVDANHDGPYQDREKQKKSEPSGAAGPLDPRNGAGHFLLYPTVDPTVGARPGR